MKTTERLKSFLDKQARLIKKVHHQPYWKYNSFEELILDCGTEMKYAPLPNNVDRGLPKNCYYNCLQLLREHPDLTYCEGYAQSEDLPLPLFHAWLIDEDRNVIDPTWDDDTAVYLGIPFDTKWFIDFLVSRNREDCLSVFESNYIEEYSLLVEGLPDYAICSAAMKRSHYHNY